MTEHPRASAMGSLRWWFTPVRAPLGDADCAGAYETLDRLRAMLWRLMR